MALFHQFLHRLHGGRSEVGGWLQRQYLRRKRWRTDLGTADGDGLFALYRGQHQTRRRPVQRLRLSSRRHVEMHQPRLPQVQSRRQSKRRDRMVHQLHLQFGWYLAMRCGVVLATSI